MKNFAVLLAVATVIASFGPQVEACRIIPHPPGIVVPERPHQLLPIQVTEHSFQTTINNGVATTSLESVFYNPNPQILEGTYLFPLPKGASISQFSLWIDGKEMPAELLDADKARDLYVSIVRRMIDPALLEFVGRETFKMRVFPLPPRDSRKIRLVYQEVLSVEGNFLRYVYPLTTVGNGREDTITKLSWQVKINSSTPIQSVFSPSHQIKVASEEKSATVTFEGSNIHPDKDVVLYISCSMKKVDMSLVPFAKKGEKGYFLMMLSPQPKIDPKESNPKDVIFVVDTSGSMVGDKIKQAKSALKYCLQQLAPEDRFNLVPFATEATKYKDALIPASPENVKAALGFVEEEIYARGGTNIDEALGYALEMAPKDEKRPCMVIFMTDGKPTIGVTDSEGIIAKVKKGNIAGLRLFTFGVGEQIDTKLLDRLAEENRGVREYVGSQEDIEVKVSSFFDKVASPVLSDIKIQFPSNDKLRISELYPREFPDLFKGSRITMLGRYDGSGDQVIRVKGVINGKDHEFVFECAFPEEESINDQVPHLWAVRKVGFLLDQIRLHGEDSELKKEVVSLAKKFGIVTPYTSYLVVEDSVQPTTTRRDDMPGRLAPQIAREFAAGNAAPEAKSAMEKDSGKEAVDASKELNRMKKAEIMGETEQERSTIRKIADKTFYLQGDTWFDSECQEKAQAKEVEVKYLSAEYFELLTKEPELGKFLALGAKVVIFWKGFVYKIS